MIIASELVKQVLPLTTHPAGMRAPGTETGSDTKSDRKRSRESYPKMRYTSLSTSCLMKSGRSCVWRGGGIRQRKRLFSQVTCAISKPGLHAATVKVLAGSYIEAMVMFWRMSAGDKRALTMMLQTWVILDCACSSVAHIWATACMRTAQNLGGRNCDRKVCGE